MSWEDMMRRILPPVDGASPHVTSRYAERFNRPEGASNPHGGTDFNYEVGGQRGINLKHPDLRSPVDGVVENAGEGTSGRIAIRDRNGNLHEILHTDRQYVSVGQPVAAGQRIGAMGSVGVVTSEGRPGAHHVHYQLKDSEGRLMDPSTFADALGPFDPNPASPAYIPEYRQYRRDARAVPAAPRDDVRILTRVPARGPRPSAFDSKPPEVSNVGPISTLPPAAQRQFGELFGLWPPFSENPVSPDLSQARPGQPNTPNDEDWSAMWRRRIGLP